MRQRTLNTKLVEASFQIGGLIDNFVWRSIWQVKLYGFLHMKLNRPWFDGKNWTEQVSQ